MFTTKGYTYTREKRCTHKIKKSVEEGLMETAYSRVQESKHEVGGGW